MAKPNLKSLSEDEFARCSLLDYCRAQLHAAHCRCARGVLKKQLDEQGVKDHRLTKWKSWCTFLERLGND